MDHSDEEKKQEGNLPRSTVDKVKEYLIEMNKDMPTHVYDPWTEGFLCGLVKMEEWGITEAEYDELNAWIQEGNVPRKVDS